MFRQTSSTRPALGRYLAIALTTVLSSRIALAEPTSDVERARLAEELEASKQRVRVLEEKLRVLDARRAESARAASGAGRGIAASCALPFFLDSTGIRKLRRECFADASTHCTYPFIVGQDGIKRLRATCATAQRD